MAAGCRREVAFVVVTWNSAAHVRKCIESIVAHALPTQRLKTIAVIDNASTDGTPAILAELKGRVPGLHVTLPTGTSVSGRQTTPASPRCRRATTC